jgi:predicted O-linked N-acetylglucosamine transferase (SPINDLY family)
MFRRAIAIKPDLADAHGGLGRALASARKFHEALEPLQHAVRLAPGAFEANYELGATLLTLGRPGEAVAALKQATAISPNHMLACLQLGVAQADARQTADAIATFTRGTQIDPNNADAWNNLGTAQLQLGKVDQAIAAFRRAISSSPQFAEAHGNLGNALLEQGLIDESIVEYQRAGELNPQNSELLGNRNYALHFSPRYSAREIGDVQRAWARQYADPLKALIRPHDNDRSQTRRLRVGYVSPDLCAHPVGRFMVPLLEAHDPTAVDVYCYAQVLTPDEITTRCRTASHTWRDINGRSDEQVAEQIRADRIDILVDLSMFLRHNRLLVFARKPAPVQVTYLAYCSTTGLDTIDYRLTDPYLDPVGMDETVYSERTVRLPRTYWCYSDDPNMPAVGPLPARSSGRITLGCLNNFNKVSEQSLAMWAMILRELADAMLILYAKEGGHRERVWAFLEAHGVERERVQFVGRVAMMEYFSTYNRIDIALDPFPWGGGTTTCDAMWMGVPTVTLRGETAVSRGGCSILSNANLTELIAATSEEYVRIVAELARDLPRLAQLRETLRDRMRNSPLTDAKQFALDVESAYRTMWHRYCAEGGA